MSYNPENPLPQLDSSDPNTIVILFDVESNHMPTADYSKKRNIVNYRREAARLIKHHGDSYSRDPIVPYLALIYFDNFVSYHLGPKMFTQTDSLAYDILKGRKDSLPLFCTCCFIYASKMRNTEFSPTDFLSKQNLNFKMEDIVVIETVIDRWLDSRNCKRPVIALSFLDFFIGELIELDVEQEKYLKSFATHKLYALQYDIRFTEFKPSIMAAAAIIHSSNKFYDGEVGYFLNTLLDCDRVNQESLKRAVEMLIPDITVVIDPESPTDVASSPTSSSYTLEPNSLAAALAQALGSAAADEADSAASTEASVEPNVALAPPKLELLEIGSSSHGSNSNIAKLMLPPSCLPPRKRPVTAADEESTSDDKSSTAKLMLPPSFLPPSFTQKDKKSG